MNVQNKSFFLVVFLIINSCVGSSVTSIFGNAAITEGGVKSFVKDTYIHAKINSKLLKMDLSTFKDINVSVFEGRVLLTGRIKNEKKRLYLIKNIWRINGVNEIYNEIKLDASYSIAEKTQDVLLKAKLNTLLLFNPEINSNNYSIEVFKMVVYVLGIATKIDESIILENAINKTANVKKTITFIRYIKERMERKE
tara:strand:- start:2983 stop:3570 length:588 start_codon:yes stop_codon:yes gene_type:complete